MEKTLKKLKVWFDKRTRSESGNSFIFFFMMMPALFAFFGLAIDFGAANYTSNSLHSALADATQSAVSASGAGGSDIRLSVSEAQNLVYRAYDSNRNLSGNTPFLACQGTAAHAFDPSGVPIRPPSGCGFTQTSFSYTPFALRGQNLVKITVIEYSKYMFLQVIGLDYQKYVVSSSARLTSATN